jgi:ABC-2 type transport system ATP-binding protein
MIRTVGLTKHFGETVAVEDLDLEVHVGEVFGFLGPNGAGKTTTIRMLAALISPTSGTASVADFEIGKQDQQIRECVGILTETPGMYDRISAERNLDFFARLYGIDAVEERIERYLRMLGLWERRHEAVGTFSKGMRQKLAIARAILHEPRVLFLDEPTSALDPEAAKTVREFIAELKDEGRTIFLCTHNLDEADRLCDRIAVFNRRLLALDTPSALRRQLYGRAVVYHLGEEGANFKSMLEALPFVQSAEAVDNKLILRIDEPEEHNPEVVRVLVNAGADIQFIGELRRSLEDVYLQLISNDGATVRS